MAKPTLRALWIVLAVAAPPCQEVNPDFDGAATGGDTSASTGAVTTMAMTTTPADDGVTGTGSGDGTGSTAADPDTLTSPPDTTATTDTPPGSTSMATTDAATTDATTGSEGSTTDGCPAPMEICAGQCVDLMMNNEHCGECFNDCHPVQEHCELGMCVNN